MLHNIKLLDNTYTNPNTPVISENVVFKNTIVFLEKTLNREFKNYTLQDLGCLDGGYSLEFAKKGFQTLGLEVRKTNYDNCLFLKNHFNLPNLEFVNDDVLNIKKFDSFDITFCSGLLYHLETPKSMLEQITQKTKSILVLNTHYIDFDDNSEYIKQFNLSKTDRHEGLSGRWYTEFHDQETHKNKDKYVLSSYNNTKSFWINKNDLIQTLYDLGYSLVLEDPKTCWQLGFKGTCRSTFYCIK
jgi:hypothetical protein